MVKTKRQLNSDKIQKGKRQLPFLIIGIGLIVISALCVFWLVMQTLQDAKSMSVRPYLPTITIVGIQVENTLTSTPVPDATSTPMPTATLVPQCNVKQPVWYILLIAKDYEEGNKEGDLPDDYTTGFADAIRLVRVDFRDASIHMLSIPRDLMVSIPGLEQYGIYQERLKMTYAYGYQYDYPGKGPGLLVDTLQSNFGFHIDQTITVNFMAFSQMIETLDGITVVVPEGVGDFPPGEMLMDGETALEYARLRDKAGEDTSDLSRIDRQTQVLFALREKVLSPAVFPHIPGLIIDFVDLVSTDINLGQINQLLCLSNTLTNVKSNEMGPEYFTIQKDAFGYERYIPHYVEIRRLVEEFQIP